MARDGFWMILIAAGIFAVGLLFFEGILGISGDRLPLPTWVMPVAVIAIGVLVLVRGLTFRERGGPAEDEEGGSDAPAPTAPDDAGQAAEAADEPVEDGPRTS
jgi:hypothetical protein